MAASEAIIPKRRASLPDCCFFESFRTFYSLLWVLFYREGDYSREPDSSPSRSLRVSPSSEDLDGEPGDLSLNPEDWAPGLTPELLGPLLTGLSSSPFDLRLLCSSTFGLCLSSIS